MAQKSWRQSFDLPGVNHGKTPIPMGARVGNILFSSGIMGADPNTGKLPGDASDQAKHAFQNMDALLKAADASLGDVGHMTVFITDSATREHVNREWLQRFPDPHERTLPAPAQHRQHCAPG